jgi:hypothetical protein
MMYKEVGEEERRSMSRQVDVEGFKLAECVLKNAFEIVLISSSFFLFKHFS